MKLNGKGRPTKIFAKKLLCFHEDESYTFRLDALLSYCQA
jgi:hypothetical protein